MCACQLTIVIRLKKKKKTEKGSSTLIQKMFPETFKNQFLKLNSCLRGYGIIWQCA